jgi:hypothetical protein
MQAEVKLISAFSQPAEHLPTSTSAHLPAVGAPR